MTPSDTLSGWSAADWGQAEQAWRDWRSAIGRHYDSDIKQRLEQAWAAGLFDSEAPFELGDGGSDSPPPGLPVQIRQPFGSQGRINLLRFQHAVGGAGVIGGPEMMGGTTWHVWRALNSDDIEKVWIAIGPFLGPVRFAAFRQALIAPELRAIRVERARRKKKQTVRTGSTTKSKEPTAATNRRKASRPSSGTGD